MPYWLGSIDVERVRPELRERIVLYKREMADVLWAAFRSSIFPPEVLAEMDAHLPPANQRYLQAADELAALRQELGLVGGQLSGVGQRLDGLEGRMQSIEAKFVGEPLGPQQQAHLKEMISAVAMAFYETTQGHAKGKGGCFSLTWHDFYRQFHIANYPELPAARMAEAVQYLAGQYRFYAGAGLPEVFRRGDQQRMI